MQSDDPAFLPVGTEVSAKFKGAFCEAKVKKATKSVKCKVALKEPPFGSLMVDDTNIRGNLVLNEVVEVIQGKNVSKAQILQVKDCSTYTVVFNDGDIRELKRTGLVLKSGKHFDTAINLDAMPLYNPESFVANLLGKNSGKGKLKRRVTNQRTPSNLSEESDEDDEEEDEPIRPSSSRIHNLRRSSSLTNVKSPDKSMRPPADPVRKVRESSVIAARRIAETPTGSTDDEQEEIGSRASGQRSITASPMMMFFDRLKRTRNASGKNTNSPSPLPRGRPKKNPEKISTPQKMSSGEESDPVEIEVKKTRRPYTRHTKPIPCSDSDDEKEPQKKISPKTRSSVQENAHTSASSTSTHHASTRSSAYRNLSEKDDPDEKEAKKPVENIFSTPKKDDTKEKETKEPTSPTKKAPPSPIKIEKRTISSSSEASKPGSIVPSNTFSKMLDKADSPTKKDFEKKILAQHLYDVGNVVLVHEYANPPSGRFYPAVIVSVKAYQTNAKIAINIEKNCVPLRSFRNSKYFTSDLKHLTFFDSSTLKKVEEVQPSLQAAFDKANNFHDKKKLPSDWDLPSIYGPGLKKIPEKAKIVKKEKEIKKEKEESVKKKDELGKLKPDEKAKEKEPKVEKKEKEVKENKLKEENKEKLKEKPKEEKKEKAKSVEKDKEKPKEEKILEKDKPKEKMDEEKKKEGKEKDEKDGEKKNIVKDENSKERKRKDSEKEKMKKKNGDSSNDDSSSSEEEDEEYNEKRDRFVAHFYKFQDESGNPMNRVPILGGKEIDLYRFYDIVTRMGGHKYITQKQMWRKVLKKLKLEDCPGANTQTVRQSYQRYFSRFEDFMKQLGYGLLNEGVGATSSRNARSTRVLEFDWKKNLKQAKEKKAKEREAKEKSKDKEKSPSESSESKAPSVKSTTTTASITPSMASKLDRGERILSATPDLLVEKEKSIEIALGKEIKTESDVEKKSIASNSKDVKQKSDKPKEKQSRERGPKRERKDSSSAIGSSDEEARKRYRRKKAEEGKERAPSSTYAKSSLESDVGYTNAHIFTRFYQGQKVHARHDSRFYDARVVTVKQPSLKDITKTLMNAYHLGKMTHSNYPDMDDINLQNLSVELKDVLKNLMNETKIFVHYLGWNSRYDEWLMLHMIRDERNSSKAVQELIPHELPPKLFVASMDWCESSDGVQSLAHIHAYSGEHQRPRRLSSSSAASITHQHRHHSTHSQSGSGGPQILVTPGQTVQLVAQTGVQNVQVVGSPPQGTTVIYQVPAGQAGSASAVVGIASPSWRPGMETQPLRTGTPMAISIQPQTIQTSSGSFSPAYHTQFVRQQSPRVERPSSAHVLVPPQPSPSPTVVIATSVNVTPLPRAGTPGQVSLGGSSPSSISSTKFAIPPNVTVTRGIGSPPLVNTVDFTPPSTTSTAPMLGSPLSEHGMISPTPFYNSNVTSSILSPRSKLDAGVSSIQQTTSEITLEAKEIIEDASISLRISSVIEKVTNVQKEDDGKEDRPLKDESELEKLMLEDEKLFEKEHVHNEEILDETKVDVTKEAADTTGISLVEELGEIEITIERTSFKDEDESGRNSVASSTATAKTISSPAASTPRGGWTRKRATRHLGPPAGVGDRKYPRTTDSSLASPRFGGETPRGGVDEEADTDESSEFEDVLPRDSSHAVKHRVMQKMETENIFDNYDFLGLSNLVFGNDSDQNVSQIEERMRVLKEIYQTTRMKLQKLEKRWKKSNEKRRQKEREARHSRDAHGLKSPSSTSVSMAEEVVSSTA